MTYRGGKNGAGVYQSIINLMPPHRVYIEPFLGSGAILRMKKTAPHNIGIDLDRAALRITLEKLGDDRPTHTKLKRGDGITFLANYKWKGDELVYCDPPYLIETRKTKVAIYKFEFTRADHIRLLDVISNIPAPVLISGYYSELYARRLKGWSLHRFNAPTRGGLAVECIWHNYSPPLKLHDYGYLGETFTQRQMIKRKVQRWKDKLEGMKLLERQALLAAISEAYK